ncbi:hypothetical protein MYX77_14855, partial [Acidobacteriia bacterium AH_259_A11_L15]|nr:hypothetical protein [Acidobacteriia bacterium AH_259_A11_L15]
TTDGKKLSWQTSPGLLGRRLSREIRHPRSEELIASAGRLLSASVLEEVQKAKMPAVEIGPADLEDAYTAGDII